MKKFTINKTNWRCTLHGWTIPKYAAYGNVSGVEYVLTDFNPQDKTLALNINLWITDRWVQCRLYGNGTIRAQKERSINASYATLYNVILNHIVEDRLWNVKPVPCKHTILQSKEAYAYDLSKGRHSNQSHLSGGDYWSSFQKGNQKIKGYTECALNLCVPVR